MITVSAKLFGVISLGTFHIPLPIDLPVGHWSAKLWQIQFDISIGPRVQAVPSHSVQAVQVQASDVSHDPPAPEVDQWN